ncbi:MAG: type II toxin-antitoxin system prevent-host-death family antitoxin [Thermodesulfobacteriota bacterium]|nr:type II toxin-antitoxin system prevent-host-death family antitoxin [Thermodesulfobacteriota bacterium]
MYPATHRRLGPNQQALRTLWTNGPLLLSSQERSERTSPFPIARTAHGRERFIITRRNKPAAALMSIDDLQIIEQHEERTGLAEVAGK